MAKNYFYFTHNENILIYIISILCVLPSKIFETVMENNKNYNLEYSLLFEWFKAKINRFGL